MWMKLHFTVKHRLQARIQYKINENRLYPLGLIIVKFRLKLLKHNKVEGVQDTPGSNPTNLSRPYLENKLRGGT